MTSADPSALGTAGIMIGCMISPDFSRRYGRRAAFVALGIVAIVGSVIQATSVVGDRAVASKWWQLVVGKIIVNSSVGVASAVVPTYLGEVSPSNIRGLVVNVYTMVQYVGGILATGTMYGLQHRTDQLPWILPIGLQMYVSPFRLYCTDARVIPAIMIIGTPFLPESPRWLIETNQPEKAVNSVRRLRVAGFDAEREVSDLSAAMKHHEELAGGTSYLDLFRRNGGNLRRTLIVLSMGCLQQGQGSESSHRHR
jgi:MFS family permease